MFDDEYDFESEDDCDDGDFDFDGDDVEDLDDLDDLDSDLMFEDPGGNSALRRATESNPRVHPCGTCGRENMLTPKDVALHYVCDICADEAERGY